MKKYFIMALCAATVITVGAQKKAVKDAKKLIGKTDKIEDARSLIKGAFTDPETATDPETYFTAAEIEWGAYDKAKNALKVNPQDASISKDVMADQLANGLSYYQKAIELEATAPKQKLTNKIKNEIASHVNDFYEVGAVRYNSQKYYPEAYEAFKYFADNSQAPDTVRAMGYFYAGVSAYSANHLNESLQAFADAVNNGYSNPNGIIYQIGCLEGIAAKDSTLENECKQKRLALAKEGYDKFGIQVPFFISNIVDSYNAQGKSAEAHKTIDDAMASYPDNSLLYGLRGWLNGVEGKDAESLADYQKAVSLPDVSSDILFKAAHKYYTFGTNLLGSLDPKVSDYSEKKKELKNQYFLPALELANKAMEASKEASEKNRINNLIQQINYGLDI